MRWSEDDDLLRRLGPRAAGALAAVGAPAGGRMLATGSARPGLDPRARRPARVERRPHRRRLPLLRLDDAALSHPFVDLAPFVPRIPSSAVRHDAYDAYLAGWADHLPAAELEEAGRLGLAVRCLYVTRTYIEGLPTLMPGDAGALAGADIDWLGKTLDALDHHLDPPPR